VEMDCRTPVCTEQGLCACDCTDVKPLAYDCPDGAVVPWCACGPQGWACLDHPEYQCPSSCRPSQDEPYPCPDGSTVPWCSCKTPECKPICKRVGTEEEGWYNSCSDELMAFGACKNCQTACLHIGTRGEGWYSSCDPQGMPVTWDQCAPTWECVRDPLMDCRGTDCREGDTRAYACPNGLDVPFCDCKPPARDCPPSCLYAGTAGEGWYDCNGVEIRRVECSECTVTCEYPGGRSEGWYSSCSGLIEYAFCATSQWVCEERPWVQCGDAWQCTGEGQGYNATGGWNACCPGLAQVDSASWSAEGCMYPDCMCMTCTACGDGRCVPPENPCNCPADCLEANMPQRTGELCGGDAECVRGLSCVAPPGTPVGVCAASCDPRAGSPEGCGSADLVCLSVPETVAAGYCLESCRGDRDCDPALRCAASSEEAPYGCLDWGDCNPLADTGCRARQQCRTVAGEAACGVAGSVGEGDRCRPEDDQCGPRLTCGHGSSCSPICQDARDCNDLRYDFCLRVDPLASYGHCAVYE
jgi:hypothetical protein